MPNKRKYRGDWKNSYAAGKASAAVQMPIAEWEKLMATIKKYEQTLKLKSDLTEAFTQVEKLRKTKAKKETLTEFLNGN